MFYRASPGACTLQHPQLIPTLVSVSVGLLEEACSWGFPAGELSISLEMFERSAKQGRLNLREHLTALASWGSSPC